MEIVEDQPTRDRVARAILVNGPSTAATLAEQLSLTPAAVRRHLDHLVEEGVVEPREQRVYGHRGRGRPAKVFALTDAGRDAFDQAYDDLAADALRFLAETAGDEAVLAFARTGYRRRDVDLRELAGTLTFPGFRRLARRYWRTGLAEMWRDVSRRSFVASVRRYVPALRGEHLVFGPSGVRAQALDPDGTLVDDFRLGGDDSVLHVRNAPSPAATASLAIGRELADEAIQRFGL